MLEFEEYKVKLNNLKPELARTKNRKNVETMFPFFRNKSYICDVKPTVSYLMDDGHSSTYSHRVVPQHDAVHSWYSVRG